MALIDPPAKKCQHCKSGTRLLQEKTSSKRIAITICPDCDGRLILFTRFDGDLPRNA